MAEAVYLTQARAQRAIELATPSILKLMETGVTNNKWIHITVLGVDGEILHEADVGPDVAKVPEWIARSTLIARGKARLHWRTGKPSIEVQARRPHVLIVGDTIHGGSSSYEGIVVAASGVQGYFDEAVSGIVAAILWGLCMDAQAGHMAQADKKPDYEASL